MPRTEGGLPQFDLPPVVETAVGVEFAPLARWDIPHFGLYWHEIREAYPRQRVLYVSPAPAGLPLLPISPQASVRCQFLNRTETRLIQVQNDRFFYNWQKLHGPEPYPHYEFLRPRFTEEWERFRQFLVAQEIGFPDIQVCEITYVNHIERGQGWDTLADLPDILKPWSGMIGTAFLSAPAGIALDVIFPLSNEKGQLRVQAQSAIRNTDGKEVFVLSLIARGHPESSEIEDVLTWLDSGHEVIVTSFADLTSPHMHKLWKRRERT